MKTIYIVLIVLAVVLVIPAIGFLSVVYLGTLNPSSFLGDSCTTGVGLMCTGVLFGVSAQNTIQLEIVNTGGSPLVFENDLVTRTNLNGCSVVSTSSSIDEQKRLENQGSALISIECGSRPSDDYITGSIFLGLQRETATIPGPDFEVMIRVSTR